MNHESPKAAETVSQHPSTRASRVAFLESLEVAIERSGKSKLQVAAGAGLHPATLHRIRNGSRDASLKTFFALAKATDVNPVRLIDGSLLKESV